MYVRVVPDLPNIFRERPKVALSDNPDIKKLKSRPRRPISAKGKNWSDGQKLEAVQTYLMLGSVRTTAAVLNIPEITVKVWRTKSWWKDLEAELKLQDKLQLGTRLKKIAERSLEVVEDRLQNGNYIFDQKTGELVRVPVNLKDAHKVGVDSMNQREILERGQADNLNEGQIDNKLAELATKFAAMVNKKIDDKRTVEMADVVDVTGENYVLSGNSLPRDAESDEEQEDLPDLQQ